MGLFTGPLFDILRAQHVISPFFELRLQGQLDLNLGLELLFSLCDIATNCVPEMSGGSLGRIISSSSTCGNYLLSSYLIYTVKSNPNIMSKPKHIIRAIQGGCLAL
jgi:hypothetical protein